MIEREIVLGVSRKRRVAMRCKMCGQTKHFALVIVGTEKICLECLARAVSVYEKLSAKQFFDVVKAHNIDMEENVDDDF